jgi:hypothetical protein
MRFVWDCKIFSSLVLKPLSAVLLLTSETESSLKRKSLKPTFAETFDCPTMNRI